ncbi:MAG: LysE family transporter [Saprospiraceae bacterium]|nr:LysE family transporter [Saprospiraceae bacterium]
MTFQLLSLGIMSSFMGALPLGMLNLTVLQLSLARREQQAILFSLGAVVVEFCQIFLTFLSMNFLLEIPHLSTALALLSIPILIYLGYKNLKNGSYTEGGQLSNKNAFLHGILLSFGNVLVYPFWLLWGNLFIQNGWLSPQPLAYSIFAFGAGLGTFGAFLAFILLGNILAKHLKRIHTVTNQLVALAFWGFAAFQIGKMIQLL